EFLEENIKILQQGISDTEKHAQDEIQIIRDATAERIALLEKAYKDEPEKLAAARKQVEDKAAADILEIETKTAQGKIELEQKIHDARVKFSEERFDQDNDYFEELASQLSKISAEYQKWAGAIGELFTGLTDLRIQNLEKEQEAVIAQRDALLEDEQRRADEQLAREELTAEQRDAVKASSRLRQAEIEEEFSKREQALEKKKIAAQRRQAIFDK